MPIPLVTRILIADDFTLVREGLKKVLGAKPDLEVVAEAADGAEAVDKALRAEVDLAILDISMPRMTGIQAAAELHRRKPELRIVILSMHDSEQLLFEALKAGASGYVLKSGADTDIVDAVRSAMLGESFLYPSAVPTRVRDYVDHGGHGDEQFDVLTPRELDGLNLRAAAHLGCGRARHHDPNGAKEDDGRKVEGHKQAGPFADARRQGEIDDDA